MAMNYKALDFESFYSTKQGYTLRKMTPAEYMLDPRFECIGCAVADGDEGRPRFEWGETLRGTFRQWRDEQRAGKKLAVISHNALFDMVLLVWRFGLVPDLMIDTMGMSQALLQPKVGYVSLAKIAAYLGLSAKTDTIQKVDGMTGDDIRAAGLWDAYCRYAVNDVVICRDIFIRLREQFPPEEFLVNDMVLRCAVKPKFKLDIDVLYEHLEKVRANKQQLLTNAGLVPDEYGRCPELMSNVKFRQMLEERGVEIPMKTSPTTGKLTEAFAKSDQGMADLEEHEDPEVQALVAARLGFKSTLEERRTERLINIADLTWPDGKQHRWMPMPLKYSGAHTHRFSGEWKINVQNFPRGGRLRDALVAPPGYVVIACDASQIEARIVAWLAALVRGEKSELVQAFANGDDVYSLFASKHIYMRVITKRDKKERFVGKQAILGLGFGMGKVRYRIQVRKDSRLQLKIEIILTEEEAATIVNGYRHGMAPAVPKAWRFLNDHFHVLANYNSGIEFGPMKFKHQEIVGPTGLSLYYPDLQQKVTPEGNEWWFKSGRMPKKLFGGKAYENIVQHLARCCNTDTALRIKRKTGIELATQSHDELVYCVPGKIEYYMDQGEQKYHLSGYAADFKQELEDTMRIRPWWGPDLPLDAESGAGLSYGDAK